jgi:radical SAM superfamily enzyme YgiQ (UPF0313 family)
MLLIVPKYKLWINFHPLGALYIAAVLEKADFCVDLIDGGCERDYFRKITEKIKKHSSVGISANIAQAYSACETARFIRGKFPGKKIVWGGPFATVEYEKLIPELADIVVLGEGERQIVQIEKGVSPALIPGIAYYDRDSMRVRVNPREPYIEPLDSLPYPAWHLTAGNRYFAPGKSPYYILVTERGCPFQCINCTKVIHGSKFRTRSVPHIIGEIRLLIDKYNAAEFHIWDDNFTLLPERTKELCRAIIAEGFNRKARFILPNGIRADICDEEMFDLMRQANFQVIIIAVESADQNVIDKLKKQLDLDKVRNTVETAVKKGFRVGLFFMMGLPFDTKDTLRKNIDFAASLPAHHVFFWRVTPFPGTRLYDMTRDKAVNLDYTKFYINYESDKVRFVHPSISEFRMNLMIRLGYLKFYGTPVRLFRIVAKLIEEQVFWRDAYLLLRCGIKLLLTGRR